MYRVINEKKRTGQNVSISGYHGNLSYNMLAKMGNAIIYGIK